MMLRGGANPRPAIEDGHLLPEADDTLEQKTEVLEVTEREREFPD
jgi:hypothetical protein